MTAVGVDVGVVDGVVLNRGTSKRVVIVFVVVRGVVYSVVDGVVFSRSNTERILGSSNGHGTEVAWVWPLLNTPP